MQNTTSNKLRLTDAIVAGAIRPDGKSEHVIWDTEASGLGLRIRETKKSWVLHYRPAGAGRSANTQKLTLGTTTTIRTTADARRLAFQFLGDIARGKDPAAERAEMKRREKAKVRDLLDNYEKHLESRGHVGRKMVMSLLRTRLAGLLDRDVKAITGPDLGAIITRLETQGLNGAAEAFRSKGRAFFSWCIKTPKVLDRNPMMQQSKDRATRKEKLAVEEHGRALTDDELKAIWLTARPDTVFNRLVRFLALTGCRRTVASRLERSWLVGGKTGHILFPAHVMKTGVAFKVPMTETLWKLIQSCPIDARSDLVFASPRTGGAISGWSKFTDELRKAAGVDFTLHDLRRTFRTNLTGSLGIDVDIAEVSIAHARRGIEKVYNRDEAEAAKRQAFMAWEKKVLWLTRTERTWRPKFSGALSTPTEIEAELQAQIDDRNAQIDAFSGLTDEQLDQMARPEPERRPEQEEWQ